MYIQQDFEGIPNQSEKLEFKIGHDLIGIAEVMVVRTNPEWEAQLEIRYIEVLPEHRGNGYLHDIVEQLREYNYSMFGTITEEGYDELVAIWDAVGADFINDFDFEI